MVVSYVRSLTRVRRYYRARQQPTPRTLQETAEIELETAAIVESNSPFSGVYVSPPVASPVRTVVQLSSCEHV